MAKKTGKCTVKVDDQSFRSKAGSATIDVGGVTRQGEMTDQGLFVYSEADQMSTVELTLIHLSDTDLIAIRNAREVKITFECDSGPVFTINGAVLQAPPKMQNGECPLVYIGPAAQ